MKLKLERIYERIASLFINIFTLNYVHMVKRRVHIEMSQMYYKDKMYEMTYSQFKREFIYTIWEDCSRQGHSLFSYKGNSQLGSSLIVFNKKAYIMSSYGLWRANAYKERFIKHLIKHKLID